jgi:ribosome-associated toxin RatA of RatAB toxin-antitoxin module
MRQQVEVSALHPTGTAKEAFAVLRDLDRHVTTEGVIRALRIERRQRDSRISHWDVRFRNGVLRWSQRDELDEDSGTMRFTSVDGDVAVLEGAWRVTDADEGVRIAFWCEFDLGIPSLSEFIDPVAKRLLKETVRAQLVEIFGPELVFHRLADPVARE